MKYLDYFIYRAYYFFRSLGDFDPIPRSVGVLSLAISFAFMTLFGVVEFLGFTAMVSCWPFLLLGWLLLYILLLMRYKTHTVWVIREKYLVETEEQKRKRGYVIVLALILVDLPIFSSGNGLRLMVGNKAPLHISFSRRDEGSRRRRVQKPFKSWGIARRNNDDATCTTSIAACAG